MHTPSDERDKPDCACSYPNPTYRNLSGHDLACPVHAWTMARLKQKGDHLQDRDEQKPMRIILCQDGVKRELVGGFEICGGFGDLQRLAEAILAKVKPHGEPQAGYGWIEIPDRVHAGGVNTPPKPWKD